MISKLTFFPVKNGDCNLIEFSDSMKMLCDCNFRSEAEEENDDYNVIKDLLTKLPNKHGLPYLDVFVLSHPDEDHCRNFKKKFWIGNDPTKGPSERDKEEKRIFIGELWYSPDVFTEHTDDLCDDAIAFKEEAERRMKLWRENDKNKDADGNRIKIIGYADDKTLNGIPDSIIITPGEEINTINGKYRNDYRIFIHAPFKNDIEGGNRNETSIVMQIRIDADGTQDAGKLILGGDAEWRVWEKIMKYNRSDKTLSWNILEAPHHCSYTFFADSRDDEPSQSSLDFLDKMEGNGFIVSSSKTIKKNSDNPPCQKAKNRYVEKLKEEGHFLCTEEDDVQRPVVFEIRKDGVHLVKDSNTKKDKEEPNATSAKPHYYG